MLRIYSETLPYADVIAPKTLRLLARHRLEVVLAVRPWQIEELPTVAAHLADAGLSLSVWPMISDDEGRWANAQNAATFVRFVRETVDVLEQAGRMPREVLIDLEPPFAQARALATRGLGAVKARPRTAPLPLFDSAGALLAGAVEDLRRRGVATSAAVWPLVALDPPGERGWQGLLGTPVDALPTDRVSVMMYTSIVEGWSRGTIRRRHASALLAAASARTIRRWGTRAGVSVGCVGTGAFEDEPVYRDPTELADDVAVVRAAGCDDLSLFDLGGVLSRAPAEAWLDAFAHASPSDPARASRRVDAARRLARVATWALGRARR